MSGPGANFDRPAFAVFASGEGSNLQRFIDLTRGVLTPQPPLPAGRGGAASQLAGASRFNRQGYLGRLALVVSDHLECRAVARAREAGIPVCALDARAYPDKAAYEREVLNALRTLDVTWLVLAGYMRLLGPTLLEPYRGRIVNVHPSLLPAFPGKDAIGQALRAGTAVTGVTVHFVDEGIDTGPPIAQARVPVLPGDTAETLAARIHVVEHALYPAVVADLLRLERME